MLVIPGDQSKVTCDGLTRRELLSVGGSSLLGISLAQMLERESLGATRSHASAPGWNRAKNVILVYLQGGPSHLDLWDPKDDVPSDVKSIYRPSQARRRAWR